MHQAEYIKDVLLRVKPQLAVKYGLKTMALFGSVLRDDFTDQSDIDILVSFSRPIGIDFVNLADELENHLGRKVDLVSRNAVKARTFAEIEADIYYV